MFKNKHVIVAMLVAPVLALISYFATDYIVGEEPTAVREGASYPMVARSNCRYASGVCTLVNGDLEIKLSVIKGVDGEPVIQMYSSQILDGVRLAFVDAATEFPPLVMSQLGSDAKQWQSELPNNAGRMDELRVAMRSTGAVFYASVGTDFFEHDTRYPEPILN